MKSDLRFSLLLALAAAVTIGIKVQLAVFDQRIDVHAYTHAIEASLMAQGFTTHYERHENQSDVVDATRGTCHMRVRDGSRGGEYHKIFVSQSGGLGPVRYSYHGQWLDSAPVLRMSFERAVAHIGATIGLSGRFHTGLAVAARGCDPEAADFSRVYQVWQRS